MGNRARMATQDQLSPAQQKSMVDTFPPPVGGWNTRDALPAMPPTDAPVLNNMVCQPSQVLQRQGAMAWSTGFGAGVNTLMPYNSSANTSRRLFAASGAGIYDATTPGAIGAAVVAGLGSSWWQYVNFATSAGQFLVAVNGADSMQTYNGAAWAATASLSITGGGSLNMNTVIGVAIYESTLYFIPTATLGFYYQPAQQIFGTVTYFNLAALCRRGGYLMAIDAWTVDGGNGPQDYFVAVTSEGEVVVYQGLAFSTAVGSPGAMSLTGVYYIGRPMGRRCTFKFGGDLLLMTERGIFPLSVALQAASINRAIAFTDKIEPSFVADTAALFGVNGWQLESDVQGQFLIANIPNTPTEQYIMQYQTRGWSQFLGWTAYCWLYITGVLYFGGLDPATGLDAVVQAYTGSTDGGNAINTQCMPAFTQLKAPGRQKHIKLVRPFWQSTGTFGYSVDGMVDYNLASPVSTPGFIGTTTAGLWDSAFWDNGIWGGGTNYTKDWRVVATWPCVAFAPFFQTSSKAGIPGLQAYDVLYTMGGVL